MLIHLIARWLIHRLWQDVILSFTSNNHHLDNDFTIVAAAHLYCDGQVERSVIQSITYLGAFVGLIVVNSISVSKGKKAALLVAQLFAIAGISRTFLFIKWLS